MFSRTMFLQANRHVRPLCEKFKIEKRLRCSLHRKYVISIISAEALHTQMPFRVNIVSEMLGDCEAERMMGFKGKGL